MRYLWDFGIEPVLALLPALWRKPVAERGRGGLDAGRNDERDLELFGAVAGLGYWYMYEMSRRIGQIMDGEARGAVPAGLSDHQIQGAALTVFYMSPLTWILFYFFFEGAARFCGAAFTESVSGSLPLYLAERLLFWVRKPEEARVGERVREHAKSFAESVSERAMVAGLEEVADEVKYTKTGEDEWMEIQASRRKEEWVAPRIVRAGGVYYRLEESWVEAGPGRFVTG